MDDGIILLKTKREAKEKLEKIRQFLKNNLMIIVLDLDLIEAVNKQ